MKDTENNTGFIQYCKECWKEDLWLKILTISSILIIVGSFLVPPMAVIDSSILIAVGELTGIGALWQFTKAMNRNINAKVKIKEIELEINRTKNGEQTDENCE